MKEPTLIKSKAFKIGKGELVISLWSDKSVRYIISLLENDLEDVYDTYSTPTGAERTYEFFLRDKDARQDLYYGRKNAIIEIDINI